MTTDYSPEMRASISRTVLGVVPFAKVLHGFRYVPSKAHPAGGTVLDMDNAREAFVSVDSARLFGPNAGSFDGAWRALVAQPVDPRHLVWVGHDHVGSFALIPWAHVGLCLVIRLPPPRWIGSEWLAFVPMEEVAQALQAVNPHRQEAQQ